MDKEDLIKKWLAEELTDSEHELFRNLDDYKLNLEVDRYAKKFKSPDFSASNHIQTLQDGIRAKSETPVRRLWSKHWLRIAGILIIGIAVYYFFDFNSSVITVQTAYGEKNTVELPDASKVVINAGSELFYNKKNWKQQKRVNLIGEAYFEVVKGGSFEVVTSRGIVRVLGTKFNVKQRDQYFEVECFEGAVKVTSGQFDEELEAGDHLKSVNGEFLLGTNTFNVPPWTTNISDFRNAPITQVFAELERQYAITVYIQGVDSDMLFTGGFVHDNLESALISVTEPLGLNYRLDSKKIAIITPK